MSNILIVDDEKNQIELLHDLLEFEGYNVFTALNINDAINELDRQTQENSNVANETNEIALDLDNISKFIVENSDSKEFIGK